MITRNYYNLDLFNGDIGICICVETGTASCSSSMAVVWWHRATYRSAPPCTPMTIHKSQGSQFEEVVIVLPGETSRLLTRELLYTAVTRAKKRVHIVGSESVIRHAITRSVQRASGLGVRLWGG